jgi:hypothetical protein
MGQPLRLLIVEDLKGDVGLLLGTHGLHKPDQWFRGIVLPLYEVTESATDRV